MSRAYQAKPPVRSFKGLMEPTTTGGGQGWQMRFVTVSPQAGNISRVASDSVLPELTAETW